MGNCFQYFGIFGRISYTYSVIFQMNVTGANREMLDLGQPDNNLSGRQMSPDI